MMNDYRFEQYDLPIPSRLLTTLVAAGVIGGIVAFSSYVAIAIWIEHAWGLAPVPGGPPTLSYGQQFGAYALLAAGLGAACGIDSMLIAHSRWLPGALISVAASSFGAWIAVSHWIDQRTRYGYDRSEWILYPPLLAIVFAAFIVVGCVGLGCAIRACWQAAHRNAK